MYPVFIEPKLNHDAAPNPDAAPKETDSETSKQPQRKKRPGKQTIQSRNRKGGAPIWVGLSNGSKRRVRFVS